VLEESVEVAGEVALEAAGCFAAALAFLDATVDVSDRWRVGSAAGDEDHVQRAVESAVAASVEAVTDCLSGRGGDRGAAGEACERGFASDPAAVRPGDQDLRRRERTDTGLLEELRRQLARERLDLPCELALLIGQCLDATSESAQREQRPTQLRVTTSLWADGGEPPQKPRPAERAEGSARISVYPTGSSGGVVTIAV
jgi:hypothetical protein